MPHGAGARGERAGWSGDAAAASESECFDFDTAAFFTQFINQIADTACIADGENERDEGEEKGGQSTHVNSVCVCVFVCVQGVYFSVGCLLGVLIQVAVTLFSFLSSFASGTLNNCVPNTDPRRDGVSSSSQPDPETCSGLTTDPTWSTMYVSSHQSTWWN